MPRPSNVPSPRGLTGPKQLAPSPPISSLGAWVDVLVLVARLGACIDRRKSLHVRPVIRL